MDFGKKILERYLSMNFIATWSKSR